MFPDPGAPYGAERFLQNLELELRAGYTPLDELDVAERLDEYLDPDCPPEIDHALLEQATRALEQWVAARQQDEATWDEATVNDRITAAFAALRAVGVFAAECLGLTIEDGWARAGLDAPEGCRGAVFFHQQDVFDALRGRSLLLAFGDPGGATEPAALAREALDTLAAHGVAASWSGRPEHRIELEPFDWRRRRFTPAPVPTAAPMPWRERPRTESLFPGPDEAQLERFHQEVRAVRTCDAFDGWLAEVMRGAWASMHGERGQVGHVGDPHTFVRAGDLTTVAPRDALTNLEPERAAALWDRARAARPPSPAPETRPWWRFWG